MKNALIKTEVKLCLIQLIDCIKNLDKDVYTQQNEVLSNSSIGEHTRHIIEFFQQLLSGYESGIIDYDNRKRNILIQQNIDFAISAILQIISGIDLKDRKMHLLTIFNNQENKIETNFNRELIYNMEHCIHHQAIIKIGLIYSGFNTLDENFGVAKSTIIYKQKCVR